MLWTGQKANSMMTRGLNVHHTRARRLKEHTNNDAPYHIREQAYVRQSPCTCPLTAL